MIHVIQMMIIACQINGSNSSALETIKQQRSCQQQRIKCVDKTYLGLQNRKDWNEEKKKYFVLKECLVK